LFVYQCTLPKYKKYFKNISKTTMEFEEKGNSVRVSGNEGAIEV
jgi:hypothetical protein